MVDLSFTEQYEITDNRVFFKITGGEANKAYRFYTVGDNADSYAELFDADLNMIASNDHFDDDENFSLTQIINAGEEYYLLVRMWGDTNFTLKCEEVSFSATSKGDSRIYVTYGNQATLEVSAITDSGTLSYQWYRYNADTETYEIIEGATNSTYTITADENASMWYECKVSNGTDEEKVSFEIEIDTGLSVSANSGNDVTVPYGGSKTMGVTATGGAGTITYQWGYISGVYAMDFIDIAGATSNTLVLEGNTNLYDEYYCRVTDGIMTEIVFFTVKLDSGLILYNAMSEDLEMAYGESVNLKVTAISTNGVLKYQWYYYDDNTYEYYLISGATSDTYELLADSKAYGDYKCVVTDGITTKNKIFFIRYTGTITDISKDCTATLAYSSVEYDGKAKTPTVTVKHGSEVLVKDEHYTVSYKNNTNVGTATVTITGRGKYEGTITKTFTIKAKPVTVTSIAKATVKLSKTSYTYDGKAKKPTVKVTLGGKTLVKGTDYTVSYKNNKKIGTATVTITGKGKYNGTVKATFKIAAKKGKVYTVGAYKYKVTSNSEVAFAGLKKANTKKVVIAKTVKIGGKTFKITSIVDKALQKKTKVTSVTVGANVKKIGKNAFNGCKNLKTITIKSTKLKTVGKNALKGINSKAKITVPSKKLKAYKNLLKGKGQAKTVRITK